MGIKKYLPLRVVGNLGLVPMSTSKDERRKPDDRQIPGRKPAMELSKGQYFPNKVWCPVIAGVQCLTRRSREKAQNTPECKSPPQLPPAGGFLSRRGCAHRSGGAGAEWNGSARGRRHKVQRSGEHGMRVGPGEFGGHGGHGYQEGQVTAAEYLRAAYEAV